MTVDQSIDHLNHSTASFIPRTPSYAHQQTAFDMSANKRLFALFMEQRTGKTKVVLDTVAYQYGQGTINALLVVAWPNGVHRNWITDEAPAHLPVTLPWYGLVWNARRAKQVAAKKRMENLLNFKGLSILAVNAEALTSENTKVYIRRFLAKRQVFFVADESTFMMTAGAKRRLTMQALGRQPNVRFKRILDGTPIGNHGPLDLYAQFAFLDPKLLGQPTSATFKAHYAEWEDKINHNTGTGYKVLVKYKNLDELHRRMAPHTFRILRKDCADLPEKQYVKRYVELTDEQRRVYDELRDTYKAELADGRQVTATLALTRYLRLQQILSNRLPERTEHRVCESCVGEGCDRCGELGIYESKSPPLIIDTNTNPRLDALEHELSTTQEPVIVWARFKHEVQEILAIGERLGRNPVRYDGALNDTAKAESLKAFQSGSSYLLVGNQRAGGRGLRMSAARTIIYYSNDFSLLTRLQSEDRAETMTQAKSTVIIDMCSSETIDEVIVQSLRDKKSIADTITGDRGGVWL